jgi:hypothetical protein
MSLTYLKGSVFLLIFANAIYFMWARGIATAPATRAPARPRA